MERKQGAAVHPSRVIARPQRPRLVVAPRTYMDFMTSNAARPKAPAKAAKTAALPVQHKSSQPQKTTSFDIKPLSAPSKVVQHTAPALKPISKIVITPPPQQVAQLPVIAEEPAVLEVNTVPEVQKPAQPTQRRHHRSTAHKRPGKLKRLFSKPTKHHVLHGVSVILFVAGVYVAAHGWFTSQAIQQQASVLGTQAQREEPVQQTTVGANTQKTLSERLPIGMSGYSVEPDLPRVVHIPSLSVMAPVLHLGLEANGLPEPSKNIYETAWYEASARPTDEHGAIVINGHVNGPTKQGVFHGLRDLKTGEEIVLERGDRHMMTFVVKRVENIEAHQFDITKLLSSVESNRLGLNLITSGDKLTIVYAVLK